MMIGHLTLFLKYFTTIFSLVLIQDRGVLEQFHMILGAFYNVFISTHVILEYLRRFGRTMNKYIWIIYMRCATFLQMMQEM